MNKVSTELKSNQKVYRELFLKAHNDFLKQINSIKAYSKCQNCFECCNVRYSELSPVEIFEFAQEDEPISKEFIKNFIPYSKDRDFKYSKNSQIDVNENNAKALKTNENYVEKILKNFPNGVYFYYCKNLDAKGVCSIEAKQTYFCKGFPQSVSTILPSNCSYKNWQQAALAKINDEISKDILLKLKEIDLYRENFSCKQTGTCCRLASSEFSYEELKLKAQNGDNFAGQFTSVFVPYENLETARSVFPEFVDMVLSTLKGEKVNFYHCKYIKDDNLCPIYDERPQICKDFPDNPLSILPPNCGFCEWKEDVNVASMLLHALIEISGFYCEKIKNAMED